VNVRVQVMRQQLQAIDQAGTRPIKVGVAIQVDHSSGLDAWQLVPACLPCQDVRILRGTIGVEAAAGDDQDIGLSRDNL